MNEAHPQKRTQIREEVRFPITYSCSFEDRGEMKNLTKKGISLNLSSGGICIYTSVRFDPNTMLDISGKSAWNGFRRGSVRWCRQITEDLFRVGIRFMN